MIFYGLLSYGLAYIFYCVYLSVDCEDQTQVRPSLVILFVGPLIHVHFTSEDDDPHILSQQEKLTHQCF